MAITFLSSACVMIAMYTRRRFIISYEQFVNARRPTLLAFYPPPFSLSYSYPCRKRRDMVFLAHLSRKARYFISRTSLPKGGMYYFLYLSLKRRDVHIVTCFLGLSSYVTENSSLHLKDK